MAQDNQTPAHYIRNGMTCDEEMAKLFSPEEVAIFYKLSAYKYRYRAGYKGPIEEDIAKAMHCEKLKVEWYKKVDAICDQQGLALALNLSNNEIDRLTQVIANDNNESNTK